MLRILYRRRLPIVAFLALGLMASAVMIAQTPVRYEASATLVPLEDPGIIHNWLRSRQAATHALQSSGPDLYPILRPAQWDADAHSWRGEPPDGERLAQQLRGHVSVSMVPALKARESHRLITVTARAETPEAAQAMTAAYLAALDALRPTLEQIAGTELFTKHDRAGNGLEAEASARAAARERDYWIVLDPPSVPGAPAPAGWLRKAALGTGAGLAVGLLAAFGAEAWVLLGALGESPARDAAPGLLRRPRRWGAEARDRGPP